jgi:subtilase family serine protease
VTVTIPTSTVAGTYYLLACADGASAVAESNETNNCRPSSTQVNVTP